MFSLRPWAGAGLGLLSLSAFVPAQASPAALADTATARPAPSAHDENADKHPPVVPILIGGCLLFTLLPDGHRGGPATVPGGLSDATTGLTVVSPAPGNLAVASSPSPGRNNGLSAGPSSVTVVPETSSWVVFACTGVGALGMALRARKRRAR